MTIALDNVVAVVTGAGGGIGREVVRAMRAAGATVIATDLAASLGDVEAEHARPLDVTAAEDWAALADFVTQEYGRIDALVHVAGISVVAPFETTAIEDWHRVHRVNVDSILIGTQALLPLLKAGGKARPGGASVVTFSSVGGLRGAAFNAAYCTSKAAVAMLTKCMGIEFGALGLGIRVNSIHPGGVDTGMLRSIMDRYVELGAVPSADAGMAGTLQHHPIGRLGKPADLGGGVVYLCSEAAAFVTCSELLIDGGYCAV